LDGFIEQRGTATVSSYTAHCVFYVPMETRLYMIFTPYDNDSHSDSRYGYYNDTNLGFYTKSYGGSGNWYAFGY
jgi:hypothetical protein